MSPEPAPPSEPVSGPGPGRCIGLDVGGTAIKAGLADANGAVLAERSCASDHGAGAAAFVDQLAALVRELAPEGADGVGLGIAGIVDARAGVLVESPNLAGLANLPLSAELERRLGPSFGRVVLENDANAAAWGEHGFGAAREVDDALLVTLGTGIGGGLVLGGRLWRGAGFAGELGHVVIDPHGRPCPCGSVGCVEQYASATAAGRRAAELGLPAEKPGDVPLLAERARAGAPAESQLLFKIGRDLGRALAAAVSLLDVGTIVVGGGFAAAFDRLEVGILAGLDERSYVARKRPPALLPALLGNRAGWLGAARLARPAAPRQTRANESGPPA